MITGHWRSQGTGDHRALAITGYWRSQDTGLQTPHQAIRTMQLMRLGAFLYAFGFEGGLVANGATVSRTLNPGLSHGEGR